MRCSRVNLQRVRSLPNPTARYEMCPARMCLRSAQSWMGSSRQSSSAEMVAWTEKTAARGAGQVTAKPGTGTPARLTTVGPSGGSSG
ncbi:hypothetical protein ASF60_19795 [Methylobacterium sp. Leaf113]|nr:hypothetical protein ASF60_19795 [Methylobacterium sp. Leaf113]